MSNVFAVDPGGTTGWAFTRGTQFASGECSEPLRFLDFALDQCDSMFAPDVVCERYTITPETAKKSRQYDALEIIGALRWICERHGWKFVLQAPADAKRFGTDARLKAVDYYYPGLGHANDAARHLLTYQVKQGLLEVPE